MSASDVHHLPHRFPPFLPLMRDDVVSTGMASAARRREYDRLAPEVV